MYIYMICVRGLIFFREKTPIVGRERERGEERGEGKEMYGGWDNENV